MDTMDPKTFSLLRVGKNILRISYSIEISFCYFCYFFFFFFILLHKLIIIFFYFFQINVFYFILSSFHNIFFLQIFWAFFIESTINLFSFCNFSICIDGMHSDLKSFQTYVRKRQVQVQGEGQAASEYCSVLV